MAEIRLEGVTKRYGAVTALDDVNLTIDTAAFTSVFGPPGSGKSVLLRVLLGLEQVDEGKILINGQDMTFASPRERNLAMVFQNLALFPHLTARDNIAFPMRRRGTAETEIEAKIDELANVLSIGHILHKKPAALSGGERQRVAIARALIREAAVYLMDEPIAALDARLRDAMRVELKRLQSELGKTFIYVTHDCDEAMSVADKMAILENGHVAQVDRPDSIYAAPASVYVAELMGSPRINVLSGSQFADFIVESLKSLSESRVPQIQSGYPDCRIALRPEAVRLHQVSEQGANTACVSDIERLGAFAIVTVSKGGESLRSVSPGDIPLAVGDDVCLTADPDGILLFDPDNGSRLI
ncbi:ABC transporter ATP-binding protein [Labrenzia sp. PHM005]|uniref:ABC transporter ATP-binding protein n=1 Tax=Labrenzia sp. PHM005 TaxID=2590016 RepID=UPI00143E0D00|nr:ABC transporter ATP-binding protein [Labrenzia sp. PHM005]